MLAELAFFIEQERDREGGTRVFKMTDLADLDKSRLQTLDGFIPENTHTTRLKHKLISHLDGLKEFKQGKTTFLAFDEDLCDVLKVVYELDDDDDNAFILSKAAEILR